MISFRSVLIGCGLLLLSTESFAIDLTVAALDAAWEKRQDLCKEYLDLAKHPDSSDFEVLWRIGRAIYYGGFYCLPEGTSNEVKEKHFKVGVDASEKAVKLNSKRVEGHYWYSVNMGGYGLAKGIRESLGQAGNMRDACTKAMEIDPKYENGGPNRIRGRLYFKLPGFISFGDNKKAYADLTKAEELGPNLKLNYIYMAEVQAKLDEDEGGGKKAALATLAKAKTLPDIAGTKEEAEYKKEIDRLEKKFK